MYSLGGWERDLTMEGIESNPGPSWDDLLEVMKEKFPLDYPNIEGDLDQLQQYLKKVFESPIITTTEVEDFFGDEKLQTEHKVSRGMVHAIKEGLSRLKGIYDMLFYSILFYSILFYSILFYSILFYSILFYSILSILFYSILFYSIRFLFPSLLFLQIILTLAFCFVLEQETRSDPLGVIPSVDEVIRLFTSSPGNYSFIHSSADLLIQYISPCL